MTADELRAELLEHNGLLTKVGTRVYPLRFPVNAVFPLVTIEQISGMRTNDDDGATGNTNPRWQFEVWSKSYKDAKETAAQLRLAVNQLPGQVGSSFIYMAQVISEIDLFDTETSMYHVPIDVMLWHNEGV